MTDEAKRYNQAARRVQCDLFAKSPHTCWEAAFWDQREEGWDADHLRVIATRTFDGHEVKVTNWISITRYLAEKDRGVDMALIYAGQFEQRVWEELGC
jgi:hypothetical protein